MPTRDRSTVNGVRNARKRVFAMIYGRMKSARLDYIDSSNHRVENLFEFAEAFSIPSAGALGAQSLASRAEPLICAPRQRMGYSGTRWHLSAGFCRLCRLVSREVVSPQQDGMAEMQQVTVVYLKRHIRT